MKDITGDGLVGNYIYIPRRDMKTTLGTVMIGLVMAIAVIGTLLILGGYLYLPFAVRLINLVVAG